MCVHVFMLFYATYAIFSLGLYSSLEYVIPCSLLSNGPYKECFSVCVLALSMDIVFLDVFIYAMLINL